MADSEDTRKKRVSKAYYRNSFVFLGLSLTSALVNYAYYPVIAHSLSTSEFGAVQVLIAILLQVGAIFSGLNLATIYLVNKLSVSESRRAVGILQKVTTSFFVLVSLLILIFQAAVGNFLHISQRSYILLLIINLVTTVPYIISFGYLQARRQFATAGLLQLCVVSIKLISGAILASRFGAAGALAGIAVGQVLGMILFWLVGRQVGAKLWDHDALRGLLPPSLAELRFIKPMAKNTGSIFSVNIVLVIYISFAIIAARHYFDSNLSGLFTAASTIASAIIFVCFPLIGVLLPNLNPKRLSASRPELIKTTGLVLAACIFSVGFMSIWSRQLLQIFGESYASVAYLLPRLGIMMSMIALFTLIAQVNAFYRPGRTAILCLAGLSALILVTINGHSSLVSFISTIMLVFATILVVGVLQIIWTYRHARD